MISSRRSFLTGLAATLITAPAIVRPSSLMPVNALLQPRKLMFVSYGQSNAIYLGSFVVRGAGETDGHLSEEGMREYGRRILQAAKSNGDNWFVPRERLTG